MDTSSASTDRHTAPTIALPGLSARLQEVRAKIRDETEREALASCLEVAAKAPTD